MSLKLKILAVVVVMIATTGNMMAQSADASANILAALTCANTSGDAGDLNFGDIVAGSNESTVTIAADALGSRSSTGNAALVATNEGGSAQFDLNGLNGAVADLTVDASVTLDDGVSNTMAVVPALSAATVTLTGGAATFYVGGTLTVGASQVTGTYTGTVNVTAEYQ